MSVGKNAQIEVNSVVKVNAQVKIKNTRRRVSRRRRTIDERQPKDTSEDDFSGFSSNCNASYENGERIVSNTSSSVRRRRTENELRRGNRTHYEERVSPSVQLLKDQGVPVICRPLKELNRSGRSSSMNSRREVHKEASDTVTTTCPPVTGGSRRSSNRRHSSCIRSDRSGCLSKGGYHLEKYNYEDFIATLRKERNLLIGTSPTIGEVNVEVIELKPQKNVTATLDVERRNMRRTDRCKDSSRDEYDRCDNSRRRCKYSGGFSLPSNGVVAEQNIRDYSKSPVRIPRISKLLSCGVSGAATETTHNDASCSNNVEDSFVLSTSKNAVARRPQELEVYSASPRRRSRHIEHSASSASASFNADGDRSAALNTTSVDSSMTPTMEISVEVSFDEAIRTLLSTPRRKRAHSKPVRIQTHPDLETSLRSGEDGSSYTGQQSGRSKYFVEDVLKSDRRRSKSCKGRPTTEISYAIKTLNDDNVEQFNSPPQTSTPVMTSPLASAKRLNAHHKSMTTDNCRFEKCKKSENAMPLAGGSNKTTNNDFHPDYSQRHKISRKNIGARQQHVTVEVYVDNLSDHHRLLEVTTTVRDDEKKRPLASWATLPEADNMQREAEISKRLSLPDAAEIIPLIESPDQCLEKALMNDHASQDMEVTSLPYVFERMYSKSSADLHKLDAAAMPVRHVPTVDLFLHETTVWCETMTAEFADEVRREADLQKTVSHSDFTDSTRFSLTNSPNQCSEDSITSDYEKQDADAEYSPFSFDRMYPKVSADLQKGDAAAAQVRQVPTVDLLLHEIIVRPESMSTEFYEDSFCETTCSRPRLLESDTSASFTVLGNERQVQCEEDIKSVMNDNVLREMTDDSIHFDELSKDFESLSPSGSSDLPPTEQAFLHDDCDKNVFFTSNSWRFDTTEDVSLIKNQLTVVAFVDDTKPSENGANAVRTDVSDTANDCLMELVDSSDYLDMRSANADMLTRERFVRISSNQHDDVDDDQTKHGLDNDNTQRNGRDEETTLWLYHTPGEGRYDETTLWLYHTPSEGSDFETTFLLYHTPSKGSNEETTLWLDNTPKDGKDDETTLWLYQPECGLTPGEGSDDDPLAEQSKDSGVSSISFSMTSKSSVGKKRKSKSCSEDQKSSIVVPMMSSTLPKGQLRRELDAIELSQISSAGNSNRSTLRFATRHRSHKLTSSVVDEPEMASSLSNETEKNGESTSSSLPVVDTVLLESFIAGVTIEHDFNDNEVDEQITVKLPRQESSDIGMYFIHPPNYDVTHRRHAAGFIGILRETPNSNLVTLSRVVKSPPIVETVVVHEFAEVFSCFTDVVFVPVHKSPLPALEASTPSSTTSDAPGGSVVVAVSFSDCRGVVTTVVPSRASRCGNDDVSTTGSDGVDEAQSLEIAVRRPGTELLVSAYLSRPPMTWTWTTSSVTYASHVTSSLERGGRKIVDEVFHFRVVSPCVERHCQSLERFAHVKRY